MDLREQNTHRCTHTEHTCNSSMMISNFSIFKGRNNDLFWNFVLLSLYHHL